MSKGAEAVSHEYLEALGRITMNFSKLEFHVSFLLWDLMGCDQRVAEASTVRMSFLNQLTLLVALAKQRMTDPEVEQVVSFTKIAAAVEQERNTMIHSTWGAIGEPGGTIFRIKGRIDLRTGYSQKTEDLTASDLDGIADRIYETISAAAQLHMLTYRYVVPRVAVNLSDRALTSVRTGADKAGAVSELMMLGRPDALELAKAHCLARAEKEDVKLGAVQLLTSAIEESKAREHVEGEDDGPP